MLPRWKIHCKRTWSSKISKFLNQKSSNWNKLNNFTTFFRRDVAAKIQNLVVVQIAKPLLSELGVRGVGVLLLSLGVVLVSVQMQIHEYPSHPSMHPNEKIMQQSHIL